MCISFTPTSHSCDYYLWTAQNLFALNYLGNRKAYSKNVKYKTPCFIFLYYFCPKHFSLQ
jgi:hypothetical protein